MAKYEQIALRVMPDGRSVTLIENTEDECFYVGIEMITDPKGKTTSEPYGCRTFFDKDEAYDELQMLCS